MTYLQRERGGERGKEREREDTTHLFCTSFAVSMSNVAMVMSSDLRSSAAGEKMLVRKLWQ